MIVDKKMVDQKMLAMGFRENISGTPMLRRAIELWEPGMMWSKELYPTLAKEFGTTAQRVERACRHAIASAFERGDTETMRLTFGYSIRADVGHPTTSEFVSRMARVCSGED